MFKLGTSLNGSRAPTRKVSCGNRSESMMACQLLEHIEPSSHTWTNQGHFFATACKNPCISLKSIHLSKNTGPRAFNYFFYKLRPWHWRLSCSWTKHYNLKVCNSPRTKGARFPKQILRRFPYLFSADFRTVPADFRAFPADFRDFWLRKLQTRKSGKEAVTRCPTAIGDE